MRRTLKIIGISLAVLAGLFVLMQAVPYGRTHSNPPTVEEPAWDSPRTRELAMRACFDCHSNHTRWPTYANVAPFSWIIQFDVDVAREVVNFSEWQRPHALADYAGKRTLEGNMPPYKYRMAHPEAQFTAEETAELARGLDATIKKADVSSTP